MNTPDNIILIGMPASGKSTVGVILAKFLGYDFMDTDLLIQVREGRRLEEIISAVGSDRFLDIEGEVLSGVEVHRTVIATGGSAVYRDGAMQHLKGLGTVVYLEAPVTALLKRLGDLRARGVALKDGQSFEELYAEREVLYRKWADVTVSEGGDGLEATVAEVYRLLQKP